MPKPLIRYAVVFVVSGLLAAVLPPVSNTHTSAVPMGALKIAP